MENNISFRDFVSMDFSKSMEKTPYMVKQNTDVLRPIQNWRFSTHEECLLAIALLLATPKEDFDINQFTKTFRFILKGIGANTIWAH
jgi:hypothetical protein